MPFTMLDEAPLFETENARMRTYATPSQNGSGLAVWRTEMEPAAAGPRHRADREQVLVVVMGRLRAVLGAEIRDLGPGDAVVVPAGVERMISNPFTEPAILISASEPDAVARTQAASHVPIPWTT